MIVTSACATSLTKHGLSKEEAAIMGECHGLQKNWLALTHSDCLEGGGSFKKSSFTN